MSGPDSLPFQVTTPAQAAALLDFTYGARLLEKFAVPSTSSQAAHALAQPANRVAYHVRKLSQAGLLRPADRQGKRVLYQAVAQVFQVPRSLVRLDEPLTLIEPLMREVTHAYAHAVLGWQMRRDAQAPEGDETQLVVRLGGQKPQPPAPGTGQAAKPEEPEPEGPYAPALRLRTVRLTPQRYEQAQAALDRLLTDLETEEGDQGAKTTTFMVMGFAGRLHQS